VYYSIHTSRRDSGSVRRRRRASPEASRTPLIWSSQLLYDLSSFQILQTILCCTRQRTERQTVLSTRNIRHFAAPETHTFCAERGIRVMTHLEVLHDLLSGG